MWMTFDGWILVALGWSPLMDENGLCQWTYMRSLGWKSSWIAFSLVDEVCWMKVVDEDKTIIWMKNLRNHCHIPTSTMARLDLCSPQAHQWNFYELQIWSCAFKALAKNSQKKSSKYFLQTMNFGDGRQPTNSKALEMLMEITNEFFFKSPL
jgi:hypothetical protein